MGVKFNPLSGRFDLVNKENIEDGTTAGQMAFWDGSNWTYTETSEMYWDDTNKRLGIGTDSPQQELDVLGQVRIIGRPYSEMSFPTSGIGFEQRFGTEYNIFTQSDLGGDGSAVFQSYDRGGGAWKDLIIRSRNIALSAEGGNVFIPNNNLGIGTTSPSAKLQVAGNVIIGAGAAGTDYTLTFDGETNDGVVTWMEDEDKLDFGNNVYINGSSSSSTPLTIKQASGQTSNSFELYDSTGTLLTYIDKYGEVYATKSQDGTTSFAALNSNTGGAAKAQFVIGQQGSGGLYTILEHLGSNFTTSGIRKANWSLFTNFHPSGTAGCGFGTQNQNDTIMYTNNTERLRVDGTSGDITIKNNLAIGAGAAGTDYTLTFDGETNDGVLTWKENDDYFQFEDKVLFAGDIEVTGAVIGLVDKIGISIDGGGGAIATGVKGDMRIPYDCEITGVTMLADQTGSIVVDIWIDSYANYPPTDSDSITSATPPTITSDIKSEDTILTDWNKTITAGDTIRYNVDSCATITKCTLILTIKRT